ncbi:MAG: flagellar M-ring protein FliF [Rickettsiales bacterium]|nr:flagellar M-ring protein FliF [Rickettsiales bacterium]
MNAMVQSLKELSQIKLASMAATAIVLIAFFIFLSLRIASPVLSPLYSNMPPEDSNMVISELDKRGIKYELRANGTQILVASDKVDEVRISLAAEGLPSQGSVVGYEVFDSTEALGTSNFVLNVNKLRALEGELGRTISSFQKIDSARVHLVVPKRELFTRDRREPTASVALKLRGGGSLENQEIAAIRHLVATAVPGLKVQRITLVDNKGRLLAKGVDEDSDPHVYAAESEEFRVNYERRLRNTIERLLEQSLGLNKVTAEVTAEIDFDRIVKNSETYDPEGQVARSIQGITETERSNEKKIDDNVTVGNNLPDADADKAGTLAQSELERNEETTNFEISKEVTNQIRETGRVRRLSVAILVDGTYTTAEDGTVTYQPRSQEELDQIEDLARSAIGFDADRGDDLRVVNMQFVSNIELGIEEGPFDWLKEDLDNIIQTLVLGGVAILAMLMVVRPLVNRTIEAAELAREEERLGMEALTAPDIAGQLADLTDGEEGEEDMINIDRINGQVKSSTYRRVNELVDQNPEETLVILRQWAFGSGD